MRTRCGHDAGGQFRFKNSRIGGAATARARGDIPGGNSIGVHACRGFTIGGPNDCVH